MDFQPSVDGCEHLPAATIYVSEPMRVQPNTLLRGAVVDGCLGTRIARGKLKDGSLYRGPLIVFEGTGSAGLRDLMIDGGRFEQRDDTTLDHRHPMNSDRRSASFPLSQPMPKCAPPDHRHYSVPVEADVLCVGGGGLRFENVHFHNAIVIGLAIGPHCTDVEVRDCSFVASGEIGLWAGSNRGLVGLPLQQEDREAQPSGIVVTHCHFERTGAAAVHLDAHGVILSKCTLTQNHCDFPYNESGGQVCIDYKSSDVLIDHCIVEKGPWLLRSVPGPGGVPKDRHLGACGLEIAGENIKIVDTVITGNATEAIHLDGARRVWICGAGTRLCANQQWVRSGALPGALEDIAVTQSVRMAQLNATTADIYVVGVALDAGVIVWSDGALRELRIPRLMVRGIDACGDTAPRVRVHNNAAGQPLLGSDSSV